MANYATLKAAIQAVIYENGNQEITGEVMQATLLSMVNSLGANFQYAGIATPNTNPGTPDQNVFYLAATAGTYANFGNIVLEENEVAILKYNGSWTKDSTGLASAEKVNQLSQEVTIISALSPQRVKSPVTMAGYSLISYTITEDGVWGTQSGQKHILIPVTPGEIYEIVAKTTYQSIIALLTSSSVTSGAAAPFVSGTSRMRIDPGDSKILVIPDTCKFLYVYEGYNYRTYQPQAINRIYDADTIVPADIHPYPFESGSISGVKTGAYLQKIDNTARLRVIVPVKNIAALRIVKPGWGLVTWAAYDGDIPTANRIGESPSARAQSFDIAGVIVASTLSFTPKFLIFVIAKDDNSDISGVTSIDDIVAIDTIDKSLFGREIVVMGDSSCDPVNRDCWARVLRARVNPMGIFGFFTGVSSSGWSTDITTPNVLGQWDGIKEQLTSSHPIVIITSGGNELGGLQLTYDETIELCGTNISTPTNPAEWAVHTLRTILADKPTARVYLVSNFYARSSTAGQDAKRRNYREMLRALCDYFSISLIDLTRNSQIRGYMESDSASSGYHIYTSDGVHATTPAGRYLIYHKIMAFVSSNEKYDV